LFRVCVPVHAFVKQRIFRAIQRPEHFLKVAKLLKQIFSSLKITDKKYSIQQRQDHTKSEICSVDFGSRATAPLTFPLVQA
jgi:hypothetical protein